MINRAIQDTSFYSQKGKKRLKLHIFIYLRGSGKIERFRILLLSHKNLKKRIHIRLWLKKVSWVVLFATNVRTVGFQHVNADLILVWLTMLRKMLCSLIIIKNIHMCLIQLCRQSIIEIETPNYFEVIYEKRKKHLLKSSLQICLSVWVMLIKILFE